MPKYFAVKEGEDGQKGGHRVGQSLEVGRPEVVVAAALVDRILFMLLCLKDGMFVFRHAWIFAAQDPHRAPSFMHGAEEGTILSSPKAEKDAAFASPQGAKKAKNGVMTSGRFGGLKNREPLKADSTGGYLKVDFHRVPGLGQGQDHVFIDIPRVFRYVKDRFFSSHEGGKIYLYLSLSLSLRRF